MENSHPCDDMRFYEIVISSYGKKLSLEDFESSMIGAKEDEVMNKFKKYELLYDFYWYIQNK